MAVQSETVELQVDNDSIVGTLVSPGSKMPGILFVHGWGGSQQRDLARAPAHHRAGLRVHDL